MISSPSGGVVSYDIKVNGTLIPGEYPVYAVHVEHAINRISMLIISLLDGSPSAESFAISASDTFVPGNMLSVEAGYDGQNSLLFEGIVTKQSLRIDNASGPVLEIECKDSAVKMTVGRKSAVYDPDTTDSDVMRQLIGNAGLTADVSPTSVMLPALIQYYATDWDFLLSRAEANGTVVRTFNNTVSVFDPAADTASVITLTYGENILSVNAELNAVTQLAEVTATAWSFQDQKLVTAQAASSLAGPGNLSSKALAGVIGLDSYRLQTSATETDAELIAWAKALMLKSELSKITGEVSFQGSAALVPGKYLSLAGLGGRFDGDHFVSSVRHEIADGNWVTVANIGLSVFSPNQENSLKGIVSKSELRVMFDDKNKVLSLITPGNNTVVLDDQNKQITVKDGNGNSIVMSESGIAIKSDKTISLEAGEKVILKGDCGIGLQSSTGDVDTSANNINQTAEMQFAAKGNMTASVQSGAELTLKAAMIMIN